jgi:hypothetical protein
LFYNSSTSNPVHLRIIFSWEIHQLHADAYTIINQCDRRNCGRSAFGAVSIKHMASLHVELMCHSCKIIPSGHLYNHVLVLCGVESRLLSWPVLAGF